MEGWTELQLVPQQELLARLNGVNLFFYSPIVVFVAAAFSMLNEVGIINAFSNNLAILPIMIAVP